MFSDVCYDPCYGDGLVMGMSLAQSQAEPSLGIIVTIMLLKRVLLALLLILLVTFADAGAAAEIGLIKKLLTTIFDRWSTIEANHFELFSGTNQTWQAYRRWSS